MPELETYTDVYTASLSDDFDPTAPGVEDELTERITLALMGQFEDDGVLPRAVLVKEIDASLLNQADDVDAFIPSCKHKDCVNCVAGRDQVRAYLREHPGVWIVMANVTYSPIWSTP